METDYEHIGAGGNNCTGPPEKAQGDTGLPILPCVRPRLSFSQLRWHVVKSVACIQYPCLNSRIVFRIGETLTLQ